MNLADQYKGYSAFKSFIVKHEDFLANTIPHAFFINAQFQQMRFLGMSLRVTCAAETHDSVVEGLSSFLTMIYTVHDLLIFICEAWAKSWNQVEIIFGENTVYLNFASNDPDVLPTNVYVKQSRYSP